MLDAEASEAPESAEPFLYNRGLFSWRSPTEASELFEEEFEEDTMPLMPLTHAARSLARCGA